MAVFGDVVSGSWDLYRIDGSDLGSEGVHVHVLVRALILGKWMRTREFDFLIWNDMYLWIRCILRVGEDKDMAVSVRVRSSCDRYHPSIHIPARTNLTIEKPSANNLLAFSKAIDPATESS